MTNEEKLAALLHEAEQLVAGGSAEVICSPFDVLMFARVLTEEERKLVGDYLLEKAKGLANETDEQRHQRLAGIGNALKPPARPPAGR